MNPTHKKCGEILYTPKITFRRKGVLTAEKTGDWWCRKCKVHVEITLGIQTDLEVEP